MHRRNRIALLERGAGLRTTVLSIDDCYLTCADVVLELDAQRRVAAARYA